jgi:hypothetical protein
VVLNTDRLIQRNQHQIIRFARLNQPSVHDVARLHLIANGGALAIDKDVALFNKAIGFATRANSAFADVFINRVDESGSINSPVKAKYTLPCGRKKMRFAPSGARCDRLRLFTQKCPAQRLATLHDEISQNQPFSAKQQPAIDNANVQDYSPLG